MARSLCARAAACGAVAVRIVGERGPRCVIRGDEVAVTSLVYIAFHGARLDELSSFSYHRKRGSAKHASRLGFSSGWCVRLRASSTNGSRHPASLRQFAAKLCPSQTAL